MDDSAGLLVVVDFLRRIQPIQPFRIHLTRSKTNLFRGLGMFRFPNTRPSLKNDLILATRLLTILESDLMLMFREKVRLYFRRKTAVMLMRK